MADDRSLDLGEREDDALDDLEDLDPVERGRGLTMRHPVLLVLVLAGAVFMAVHHWPRAAYLLQAGEPADCGDISRRPGLKADNPEALPKLEHDRYCKLVGTIQSWAILAAGGPEKDDPTASPQARNAGRKYYLKLVGDRVFVVLAADREDVINYRLRHGNLLGFEVNETGRMIDPDRERGYDTVAETLRLKFSIPEGEPIRIFDTTDQPLDRWPQALVVVLMGFTALLALFGLGRFAIRRIRSTA